VKPIYDENEHGRSNGGENKHGHINGGSARALQISLIHQDVASIALYYSVYC
jgi:hypothetical protein